MLKLINFFLIIYVLLLLFSCSSREKDLKGIWMGTYGINYNELDQNELDKIENKEFVKFILDMHTDTFNNSVIYIFGKDSLSVKMYSGIKYGYLKKEYQVDYILRDDSIIIPFEREKRLEQEEILTFKVSKNELVLYQKIEGFLEELNLFFKPLRKFKQQEKVSYFLNDLLVNKNFKNNLDATILEFTTQRKSTIGKVLVKDSEEGSRWKNSQYWKIITIEEELLLVIDDVIIHIVDITDNEIQGLIYGEENTRVSFWAITK